MCLQKNCFKYNNKPAHWVGQSKLRFLDIDELFKWTPKFDENQACVTGKTEEEKNTSKKTTDDADTNAEDNKNIHKNREIVVTIEEENKIKRRLNEANKEQYDWKFQIHLNKLEWVNPRIHNEQKIHFVCLLKVFS